MICLHYSLSVPKSKGALFLFLVILCFHELIFLDFYSFICYHGMGGTAMISSFDIHNLDLLLKDFYIAVGIRISIFDDEFRLVTEYPKEAPKFCTLIRGTEKGLAACHACDEAAMKRAKKLRGPHIYTCHAGITEAVTPIQLGGGVLGYAILAHMLPREDVKAAACRAADRAARYGVPKEESLPALDSITQRSAEQIRAAVRVLDAIASYVYISNLARWKNDDLSVRLEKFIEENLSGELSGEIVCKQFSCSRSMLYHLSMQTFGMGLMRYVRYRRIERAKQLLEEGRTVAETAEGSGFGDYNYFCKVFRKAEGISPAEYRKRAFFRR